jgi:hypothetical protein
VPLVVRQPASREVDRWLGEDGDVVVWVLTGVEVVSALRRLVRDGELTEPAARRAEQLADDLLARTHAVTDLERVKGIAIRLLRVHALRAADALQLAAALVWADAAPAGLIVHTLDRRLGTAAEREGFEVIPAE